MNRSSLAAFVLITLLGASGCAWFFASVETMFQLCGNDILATAVSPDGSVKAVLFERDCGATTGFSEQISLLKNGDALPHKSGNIFQADGGGPNDVRNRMVWKNNNTLQIVHPKGTKIYWKTDRRDVKIGWGFSSRSIRIVYK